MPSETEKNTLLLTAGDVESWVAEYGTLWPAHLDPELDLVVLADEAALLAALGAYAELALGPLDDFEALMRMLDPDTSIPAGER